MSLVPERMGLRLCCFWRSHCDAERHQMKWKLELCLQLVYQEAVGTELAFQQEVCQEMYLLCQDGPPLQEADLAWLRLALAD